MTERKPLEFALDIPFAQSLGMQLWRFDSGFAEISLDVRPEMLNSWRVAHGGVVMTLLDVVMAHAARSVRHDDGGLATIEMKTQFMRPAETRLVATGKLLHATARTAFCEGSVHDASGLLCAHATGTFKYATALRRAGDTPAA